MQKLLITFTFVALAIVSYGQDRAGFDISMQSAYYALGQSDYKQALKFFKEAQKSKVLKQENELGLKMLVDELVELTERRKELGIIQPSVHHKIGVLYVEQVAGPYVNSAGEKMVVERTLTEDDKKAVRNRLDVIREVYEAISDGNFTIDYDEISITAPLTSVRLKEFTPWPVWESYDGAVPFIKANFDTHDTFVWCSNLISGEGHGGFSRFPLGQGRLTPQKGFIEVNPLFSHNLWIHEMFHVVENMAGISPAHGHHTENKPKFPGWHGKAGNELDYYAWQFTTTIPAKGYNKLKINTKLADEDPGDPIIDLDSYKTVAYWTPKQVTNDWSVQEWKITGEEITAGPLKIMMLYTHGWKAIEIASVAVWQDDKQMAIDEHHGSSGTKKRNIVYTLDVPRDLKGNFYIKAKIKGALGTDSNGQVMMKVER